MDFHISNIKPSCNTTLCNNDFSDAVVADVLSHVCIISIAVVHHTQFKFICDSIILIVCIWFKIESDVRSSSHQSCLCGGGRSSSSSGFFSDWGRCCCCSIPLRLSLFTLGSGWARCCLRSRWWRW